MEMRKMMARTHNHNNNKNTQKKVYKKKQANATHTYNIISKLVYL